MQPDSGITMTKFSAYLSIYNDWDILPHALASIKDHVDELVVVDGAYEWMESYLRALGKDPLRSEQRLYDIIEDSGIPFKIISKTWKNEIEKRMAGYDACSHRYVYRVDADEVVFFDDGALQKFLASDHAMAEMQIPLYDEPGLIDTLVSETGHPRQVFLFDRSKISAEQHLHYLWLILTGDHLAPYEKSQAAISTEPVAFIAHLSHWRTPQGSVQRCAFYQMNWMRFNGVPFAPDIEDRPLPNFDRLFALVPPDIFLGSILRDSICTGSIRLCDHVIRPSPLSPAQEGSFSDLYRVKMEAIERLNHDALSEWQPFITGVGVYFDVSRGCLADVISRNGQLQISVRGRFVGLGATAIVLNEESPFFHHVPLPTETHEGSATVAIASALEGIRHRRIFLSLYIHLGDNQKWGHFKVSR